MNLFKIFTVAIIMTIITPMVIMAAGAQEEGEENYPNKEIVLIVPAGAGGGTDKVGRLVAKLLEEELGVPIVVQNKPGAGGVVALNEVISAKPDGYTMGIWANRGMMTAVVLGEGAKFEADSFEYLAGVNNTAELVIMRPGSSIKNTDQFIAAAKAKPGSITIGIPGTGPVTAYVQMQKEMGIDIEPIVYAGGAKTIPAILGGHVEAGILSASFADTVREQGSVIIGVTAAERLESIPNIPTFVEQGYEGLVNETTRIFMVNKDTPEDRIQILADAFDKIAEGPLQDKLREVNEVPLYRGREDINTFLKGNFPVFREILENNRQEFIK